MTVPASPTHPFTHEAAPQAAAQDLPHPAPGRLWPQRFGAKPANGPPPDTMAARLRAMTLALAALGYLILVLLISAVVASALLRMAWKHPIAELDPLSVATYRSAVNDIQAAWSDTADHPESRRRVAAIIALPLGVFGLLIPFGAMAAVQHARPLHGQARFANRQEIARAGLFNDDGILLGRLAPDHAASVVGQAPRASRLGTSSSGTGKGQYLRLAGQQSVLLSAPTRSGKGVGVVIPNLLAWRGSAVVLDIKGENFAATAGFRAAHGQDVFCWAPFTPDGRTHRWNPLGYIRDDARHVIGDTLEVASMLYPVSPNSSSNEAFFNDQARNLFLGLALLLVATPERPRTIGELLRQASGQGRTLHEHLRNLIAARQLANRPLPDACVDALNRFLSTSDNTASSILATLNAPLTVFADPMVDAATSPATGSGTGPATGQASVSASEFPDVVGEGPDLNVGDFDLRLLRRRAQTIYLVIPANRLANCSVLLNLFFAQTVALNTDTLPEEDPSLSVPCLLLLDEAAAVGRIAILAKAVGYLSGFNLRLLTVVQSMSQLESVYGRDDARTFATNHAAQILFAPREQRDANEYSEMLGTFTQRERSNGRSVSSGARGSSTSTSHNESSQKRSLLLPQEFKELGQDRAVILLENSKPILAEKIRYHNDPVFTQRLQLPPEIPWIDLDLHLARVEQRVRPIKTDEVPKADAIAEDFAALRGTLDGTPEGLQEFARGFAKQITQERTHGAARAASGASAVSAGRVGTIGTAETAAALTGAGDGSGSSGGPGNDVGGEESDTTWQATSTNQADDEADLEVWSRPTLEVDAAARGKAPSSEIDAKTAGLESKGRHSPDRGRE